MIILDTDHVNELQNSRGAAYRVLTAKMASSTDQDFVTTVVTLEEQMRGWLAHIHRATDVIAQVHRYEKLDEVVNFFSRWRRLAFDDASADQFKQLRKQKIRIGSMDLKIASIALTSGCLLLSANLRDFQQVPNLQVEDWLH